jgi:hypothetical protein
MLAQIPHVLWRPTRTIGSRDQRDAVLPAASARKKPYIRFYRRCNGQVDLSSIKGPGFGYGSTKSNGAA